MFNHSSTLQEINRSQSARYPQHTQPQIIIEKEVRRSKSERYQYQNQNQNQNQNQSQNQSQNQNQNAPSLSKREIEMRKAKRKSNAHLAVEAVQQELDAVRVLKRLSMGGSLTVDPDLSFGAESELQIQRAKQHRRRSSSSSSMSSVSTDEEDTTLFEDDFAQNLEDEDSDAKANAEKLLWVPAKAHPSIAPDQFRRHVQSTLTDMTNKKTSPEKLKDSSIPSLKELTDELDKLSEMTGLAATDAVTLARSLSSASDSTSLLYGDLEGSSSHSSPKQSSSSRDAQLGPNDQDSDDSIDQDAPLFSDSSSSLKRNQWTTYSRSRRGGKSNFPNRRQHSPLMDENKFPTEGSFSSSSESTLISTESTSSISSTSQPASSTTELKKHSPHQQQRSVSAQQERPKYESSLSRSQSDVAPSSPTSGSSAAAQNMRTNHSRNRHAGSLITLESNQSNEQSKQPPHHQQQHQQHANNNPQQQDRHHHQQHPHKQHHSQQQQQQQHQHQKPPQQQQHRYPPQQQQQQQSKGQQYQSRPLPQPSQQQTQQQHHQLHQKKQGPRPSYASKNSLTIKTSNSPPDSSPLTSSSPIQSSPSPTQQAFRSSPTNSLLQDHKSPTTPTGPIGLMEAAPILNKDNKKESKSKDFLNLFKKKRSSPKILDTVKRKVIPTNDENSLIQSLQKDDTNQHGQQSSEPQRPSLRNTKSKSSKKEGLQDSVKIIPKQEALSESYSYTTGDPRAHEAEKKKLQQLQQQHQQSSSQQRSPPPPPLSEDFEGPDEQHRLQKESLSKKLSLENLKKSSKPNAPLQFTESAFGFPLPPLSNSTLIMLDHRFPIHVERALYRLSHLKLANPKRALRQQVLLSNFMYAYLNLVNHTLYLQQLSEENTEEIPLESL